MRARPATQARVSARMSVDMTTTGRSSKSALSSRALRASAAASGSDGQPYNTQAMSDSKALYWCCSASSAVA